MQICDVISGGPCLESHRSAFLWGSSGDGPLLRALVAGRIPFQWFVAEGWSPPFLQVAQSPLALQPELNECRSLQTLLT